MGSSCMRSARARAFDTRVCSKSVLGRAERKVGVPPASISSSVTGGRWATAPRHTPATRAPGAGRRA
jgi:hypothetical protein